MNTKLVFFTFLSVFVFQAFSAGLFYLPRDEYEWSPNRPYAGGNSPRSHQPRSHQQLAAQAFRAAEDNCPAVSAMPDCGAQCINSVGPANGCPTAGDVQCNCRNAKIIQSAAEACVLVSCGPITAISVQSAASAICDQCAAPSAAVQGDDIKVVEARPTWRQVLDPRPKPRPTQWRDILSPQPTWHQVIDPRRKPQITINRAAGAGVAAAPQPTNHNVVAARQATGTEKPGPDEIPCDLPECWGGLEVVEKQPEPEVDAVIPCLAPDCWA